MSIFNPRTQTEFEGLIVRTVADDPALVDTIQGLVDAVWPLYMREMHYARGARYRPDYFGLFKRWPHLQTAIYDPGSEEIIASTMACALAWEGDEQDLPDEGWDWQVTTAAADHDAGSKPTTLGAVSITIHPDHRGRALSSGLLRLMRQLGRQEGTRRLIAPVRPTTKAHHPFTDMDEFLSWETPEGYSQDPWIRTHQRLGARVVRPCRLSMQLDGTVAEWSAVTGEIFTRSGDYPIANGLHPLRIDLDADYGYYAEPNVWMVHDLD
jgi:GNAT superfamily N-acetyltransferase